MRPLIQWNCENDRECADGPIMKVDHIVRRIAGPERARRVAVVALEDAAAVDPDAFAHLDLPSAGERMEKRWPTSARPWKGTMS